MTIPAAPFELVHRSSSTRLRELGNDLSALWRRDANEVGGWMSRPSILRRVASELATRLAPDTDRVIAIGPGSLVLGGAMSLTTGLPFCAVDRDGSVFGDYHAGETVTVVSVDNDTAEPGWITLLEVTRRLSVVATGTHQRTDDVLVSLHSRHDIAAPKGHPHE
jgi:hypothetical protein